MQSRTLGIKQGIWDNENRNNDLVVNKLIYDTWNHLSDDYYTLNVRVANEDEYKHKWELRHAEIFVLGEVEEGTYLTTSIIPGVAQPTLNKAVAFAVAKESRKIKVGEPFLKVGVIHVAFL